MAILSGIILRYDKLNRKATRVSKHFKEEYEARNICFIDHRIISSKHNCNNNGTKKLTEDILFCFFKSN